MPASRGAVNPAPLPESPTLGVKPSNTGCEKLGLGCLNPAQLWPVCSASQAQALYRRMSTAAFGGSQRVPQPQRLSGQCPNSSVCPAMRMHRLPPQHRTGEQGKRLPRALMPPRVPQLLARAFTGYAVPPGRSPAPCMAQGGSRWVGRPL